MPKYTVTKNMGSALRNLRQYRKVKAIELAKAINKTGAYISKLEKGELNTIDCDDFIDIIRTMSNSPEEFSEAIDILLKDTSMEFTEEESENEEWKMNLDYFYRLLPLKSSYQDLIKNKMESLNLSPSELSNYINQNFDLYNDATFNKEELDKAPRNRWNFNNNNPYVLMEIPPTEIERIINSDNDVSCYGNMFCILMSLYRIEKYEKEKAYKQAHEDLLSMQIFTLRDTENVMQTYDQERQIHDLLSQRDNENLPEENRKLLSSLNEFVQRVHSFSIIDINYANEKMTSINNLLESDPVLALKLLGTDLILLKNKPTELKKEFFNALEDLVKEYSSKEVNKKTIELL